MKNNIANNTVTHSTGKTSEAQSLTTALSAMSIPGGKPASPMAVFPVALMIILYRKSRPKASGCEATMFNVGDLANFTPRAKAELTFRTP
jgi:hypothetical protein